MKKIEKIIGISVIVLMLIRLVYNFPFSSQLIVFPTLFLMLLYFFFSFALLNSISFRKMFKKVSYKGISTWRIIGSIGVGFALLTTITGILFVFQRWPFGYVNLKNGLIMLGVILIVIILKASLSFHKFYTYVILRICIVGLIGIALLCLPTATLFEMKCSTCPESYIEAEKALMNDPDNIELQRKADEEFAKMQHEK
jgi:hypothetical protein